MIDILPKEINSIKDRKKKKRERRRIVDVQPSNLCTNNQTVSSFLPVIIDQQFKSNNINNRSSLKININNIINTKKEEIVECSNNLDSTTNVENCSSSSSSSSSSLSTTIIDDCINYNNISNNNNNNNNNKIYKQQDQLIFRMEVDGGLNEDNNNNNNIYNGKKMNKNKNIEESIEIGMMNEENNEVSSYEYMDIDNNSWYSGDPFVSEVLKDEKETLGLIEKKRLELESVERTISTLREAKDSILKDIMIKTQFLKSVQRKKEDQIKTITNSYHSIATKYNLSQIESRSLTLILPEEVMLHILKFLSPIDLCRGVCRVSLKWRSLAFDISLWRDICLQRRLLDGSNYGYFPLIDNQLTNNNNLLLESESLSNSNNSIGSSCSTYSSSTSSTSSSSKPLYGDNWYVGEFRKDNNWRKGKYSTTIIRGHKEIVWSLLFESDSNTLISGSEDMTVKVWDCNGIGSSGNNNGIGQYQDDIEDSKKRCMKTLTGHKNGTICLGSTPTRLVSGSADGSLKIWDRQEGNCLETIQTHSSVWCLQIMGNQLICGCVDGTMKVFDLNTSGCVRTMRGHTAPVRCLQSVNHNGQELIVSGSYDKSIKIWDMNGTCVNTIRAHTHKINCLQYENGQLVSGSHDSLLKIWDMNGGLIHTLQGHDNMIHCLQFKGNKLLSGSTDSTIRLWDLKTGSHINTIKGQSAVCCLKFNDSKLITGYEDSSIKIFDFS
ncbi:hypothetical protein ACTFIY_006980 [Dictyostelium cf. discoideum]